MSCGGGGGCTGTFDAFGNFIPGVCPSPGPGRGFALETIAVYPGPPPTHTPTPGPSVTKTPTPTTSATPTPLATTTAVPAGSGPLPFHAVGTFVNPRGKVQAVDITNDPDTLWTSNNPNALQPPPGEQGGVYNPIAPGCACANVSAGGINGNPVGVTVFSGPPTPTCGECPTPVPTPTPAAAASAQLRAAAPPPARIQGVLEWTFNAVMPLGSHIAASPDGRAYFLTLDGTLHALDARGKERWHRGSAGNSLAVGSDGTVFALEPDRSLIALSRSGKPQWSSATRSSRGPLAATADEVYLQSGNKLLGILAPGIVHWETPVEGEVISAAALSPDETLIAGVEGGQVIAVGANGVRRWAFTPDRGFAGSVAIRDGQVFVGSRSGTLYALDIESGVEQWHFASQGAVVAGPATNDVGPVFFVSDALYALTPNGELAWSLNFGRPSRTSLSPDGGGLFGAVGDNASLFNSDGTYKWNTRSFGEVTTSTVSPNGTLYVATRAGHIYAIR